MSFQFPILKVRSRSVMFIFEFEQVAVPEPIVLKGKGNEKADRTPVLQNFKEYTISINQAGIPVNCFMGHHASEIKNTVDHIFKKARMFFIPVQYIPENIDTDEDSYREFKKRRLEELIKDYQTIYFFDADATFINQLKEAYPDEEQFQFFTVEQ